MSLLRPLLAALVPCVLAGCSEGPPPPADTERGLLDRRHAVLEDLVAIVSEIPDPLPMDAARERLRALAVDAMPAIEGSWDAFQVELDARIGEPAYGQRAQAYQALKGRFDAEIARLREDPILWRNLAPELVRFNAIFQPSSARR